MKPQNLNEESLISNSISSQEVYFFKEISLKYSKIHIVFNLPPYLQQ